MHYKQLTEKNKVEIDILLKQNMSMREVGRRLGISHSAISRYKAGKYKKRKIDINKKYDIWVCQEKCVSCLKYHIKIINEQIQFG